MGLSVRDDPKRVVDPETRQWGSPVDGFALSIESVLLREDRSVMSNLSVVLRNVSDATRSLAVPGWLFFFHVEMTAPDGMPVPVSAFGGGLLDFGLGGLVLRDERAVEVGRGAGTALDPLPCPVPGFEGLLDGGGGV